MCLSHRHCIVETEPGGGCLLVVGRHLPEMKIQQQVRNYDQISQVPQLNLRQSKFEEFRTLTYVSIGLMISKTQH